MPIFKNEFSVSLRIQPAALAAGITSPFALWKRFGGSKSTTEALWGNRETGVSDLSSVQFDTLEKLMTLFNMKPEDI